ncbi:receptor-activated Ca2+-permeable cation channel [Infundibulicybe gibba]|nr:receptor-activated Ca2+-permeable cation channel [Infundibulicybe gibba]
MDPEQSTYLLAPSPEQLASVKVFPVISALKADVINTIDSALTWDQLTASDINFSIVRPLVFKYARLKNMAVVPARGGPRIRRRDVLSRQSERASRYETFEPLCIKPHRTCCILTTTWNPLAGAAPEVVEEVRQVVNADDMNSPESALEMAISTQAKAFLATPVAQKVVNDIYSGRVVFSMAANRSVLADNYKPRAIEIYDSRTAPFLDHYRLRVPRYGAILEFLNFALLLLTFMLCLSNQNTMAVTPWEVAFIIFGVAFALEEYAAATEHGWIIYVANMWNVFDFTFILLFLGYLGLRIQGLSNNDASASNMAFDILACGACILFPRLAFFAVSNNMVVLSLRAMIAEFVFFIGIAAICFSGLLFTLWKLSQDEGTAPNHWTIKSIAWLMVQIWFGNTYLSFAQASSFHPLFGPVLMTCFAALSNTLLLTILVSILSNTVARINENATQEYLFQFTINTIEGVKSDALFSYQPPFNILAFLILKPASWFLSPRALHTVNVFLIRLTSLPILVIIGVYERHFAVGQKFRESSKGAAQSLINSLPRQIKNIPLIEALVGSSSNDLYDAIFDIDAPPESGLFYDSDDDFQAGIRSFPSRDNMRAAGSPTPRSRRRLSSRERSSVRDNAALLDSPRPRIITSLAPELSIPDAGRSPLARLFAQRPVLDHLPVPNVENSMKKIESLMEDVCKLPVHKLKDEMKELQDRQARIENLLLVLTRGMRNDSEN